MNTIAVRETRWVLSSQAARMIGVSPGYIRVLVDTGRLRARRGPLGIRLIDRTAVEQFAQERQIKKTDQKTK